jgi:hypothetical protein
VAFAVDRGRGTDQEAGADYHRLRRGQRG